VEDIGPCRDGGRVRGVDVRCRLDRQREVMEARRVQLELLVSLGLAQPDRARAGGGEPEVVDLLPALAAEEHRRLEAEWLEHGCVELDRALEVAADEVDMAEPDEHAQDESRESASDFSIDSTSNVETST